MKFVKGFQKVAAPKWFHTAHLGIPASAAIKNHSKKGLKELLKRRGIK